MEIEVRASPSAEDVAAFLEIESNELAERDQFQRPIGRWLASDGHTSVGLATASIRPDDRLFGRRHRGPSRGSDRDLRHRHLGRRVSRLSRPRRPKAATRLNPTNDQITTGVTSFMNEPGLRVHVQVKLAATGRTARRPFTPAAGTCWSNCGRQTLVLARAAGSGRGRGGSIGSSPPLRRCA